MKRTHQQGLMLAATALLCGPSIAQDDRDPGAEAAWDSAIEYERYLGDTDLRASDLVGAPVKTVDGEALGEVEDLIISRDDSVVTAVVSVGGIFGLGTKTIGVPYEQFRVAPDGTTLYLDLDAERLRRQPEFEYAERVSAVQPAPLDDGVGARGASRGRDETAQNDVGDDTPSSQSSAVTSGRSPEAQPQQPAQAHSDQSPSSERVQMIDRSEHRASEIIGMAVIDSEGTKVGEVDDLIVSPDDGETHAVLAIGGILGLGVRLVSVPLGELDLGGAARRVAAASPETAARGDADDESGVRINVTGNELLESRPEFRYEASGGSGFSREPTTRGSAVSREPTTRGSGFSRDLQEVRAEPLRQARAP